MAGEGVPGRGAAGTWLTAACSLSARSQKQQPIWFPHWPTAIGERKEGGQTLEGPAGLRAARVLTLPAQLTLNDHRLGHPAERPVPRPQAPAPAFEFPAHRGAGRP